MSKIEQFPVSAAAAMERGETPETQAPMKLSEWLDTIGSHLIYDHKELAADFKEKTGLVPSWPVHTAGETKRAIEARGLGGELDKRPKPAAWGWEIGESLAAHYADFQGSNKFGRGSRFREAVDAVRKAGL